MRQAPWHFCILIPARNEEVLLARCLTSIVKACSRLPPSVTYDIVIAVDCSTDKTLEIAHSMTAAIGAVVSTQAGVVGETRALAARVALERYAGPLNRCWLANTDADCIVPQNWLLDQLSFASADLDALRELSKWTPLRNMIQVSPSVSVLLTDSARRFSFACARRKSWYSRGCLFASRRLGKPCHRRRP